MIKLGKWMLLIGLVYFGVTSFAQNAPAVRQQADQLSAEADSLFYDQQNLSKLKDSLTLVKYQQAKTIYLAHKWIVPNLADACLNMGIIYQTDEKYQQAISAYRESSLYLKKIYPQIDSSYIVPFLFTADCYKALDKYDSADIYYAQVELLLARFPKSKYAIRFYNSLGGMYYAYGNYVQSINYFEKALKKLQFNPKKPNEEKLIRYVIYNSNIAGVLRKIGHYQEAIVRTKEMLRYNFIPNILYQNIATAYLQMNNADSAQTYLNKINITDINFNPVPGKKLNPRKAEVEYYTSLGLVALLEKDGRALTYFDKARHLSFKSFGAKNDQLAYAYASKGQVYEKQQNYTAALDNYQLAIQALHFKFNNPDIYSNPADLVNTVSPLLLFKFLSQKAQAFRQYHARTRNTKDLQTSLRTYQLAFQLAELIRKSYDSDKAKLFFTNTVSPVYEEAIATAYQLFTQTTQKNYLEVAFALAEQSKAAVLAESLRELEIRKVPGISDALLQRERNLKLKITALNLSLSGENELSKIDPAKEENYRDNLRENEIELAKILTKLEKNKQYYQLKYDTSSVTINTIQKNLDNQTAFVEYFVGKKHLYVFVITQAGLQARQLGLTATFNRDWQVLYNALYQAKTGFRYQGDAVAHKLYRQLIAPVIASLVGKQRLIIIPDKELCYLPFEALVSEFQTTRYLLQDYIIRYAYSGKLLHHTLEKRTLGQGASILAMAPFTQDNSEGLGLRADKLTPLYASAQEVEQIGGQIYKGRNATKEQLMQQAAEGYDIIHLATHAKADIREPLHSFIAFYPKVDAPNNYRLYAREIYNLRLDKLKLVVLSACETGGGQLVQGEGIMSLARAFAYAGCPSTVTTLWKAEDKTTAYISMQLYKYLKAGKPKDVALRLAKLDYLENQTDWRQRSPVYWANFILIGDQAPVYPNYSFLWGILGGILTIIAGWVFYKKCWS